MPHQRRLVSFIVILASVMFGFVMFQNASGATPVREDYKEAAAYLERNATPEDVIAVSAPFTVYPLEYTYQGTSAITTVPEWDRYEDGPIPPYDEGALKKQLDKHKKQHVRIFLVLSYDQGYRDRLKNYFDKNLQLLAKQQFNAQIEIRVYRLRYDLAP